MKTDAQLQKDVIDELRSQPNLASLEIGVATREAVVTLTGAVPSFTQKLAALQAARRVFGVRAVADEIEVRLPAITTKSDTEIAHAAIDALKWDVEVPDERIRLSVTDGWVTLEGSVDWHYQRRAADRAVRRLIGVKGVIDRITVAQPRIAPAEVKRRIADALRRSATVDSQRITVEAHDSKVTLRGNVRSWAERDDAESAAWAVPGVTGVEDLLVVAP